MTRISADVNDEWLEAAKEIIAALDSVQLDFAGSGKAWGHGGGRDLCRLVDRARDRGEVIEAG
jgi:hypothetical protein